jgi:hypothetical protein
MQDERQAEPGPIADASGEADRPPSPLLRIVRRTGVGVAGVIYGTIVVMSVIDAGAEGLDARPGQLALAVIATSIVFWAAHVYAHSLGSSIDRGSRLAVADVRHVARYESSILLTAVVPVLVLELGAFGVISSSLAVALALIVGVATLLAEALIIARIERRGLAGTALLVGTNLVLAMVLVALKALLSH